MSEPTSNAEQTAVTFTAADWAQLHALADLLKRFIQSSREETAAIRESIRASDERLDRAVREAHGRIDQAHDRINRQDKLMARWIGSGVGIGASAIIVWAVLKFIFNRG
jgi:ElaB/YqjD/DUF883 family membrane-anchored ribosome-binding protein